MFSVWSVDFSGLLRKKSLEEIFKKKWPMARNQSIIQVGWKQNLKIKILTENTLEYLAFGKGFIWDRIGDARIFGAARAENKSQNLFFAESRQK